MATHTAAERRAAITAAADHFVHFYESDDVLAAEVSRFLGNGLQVGTAAILIATPEHVDAIFAEWRRQGVDVAHARAYSRLIVLDARETLDKFLVDGMPDAVLFDEFVGGMVRTSLSRFDELVAFGEMVSLLWREGRVAAAIQLERLWGALAARHRFALYCAYAMRDCAEAHLSEPFSEICRMHSHVIPAEAMSLPRSEAEQVRWIAELQQKAAALATELARRRKAERELADLVDNAAIGIHRVGPDGTILYANRAELEMLGYAASEYVGRNVTEIYADRGVVDGILASLWRGDTLRDQPARLRCKDGSLRHVLITSNALFEDGQLVSTRCFTRDVSDRWLAQEALRERSAVLHLAMQGARMGYWVGDLEAGSIRCSHELAALLGLQEPLDWPLESFLSLLHPEDRTRFELALRGSIEGRGMLQCVFRMERGGEWRPFEARGEAVYDAEGAPTRFYGVCAETSPERSTGPSSLTITR